MFIFPQFHTSSLLSCPITRLLEYRSDHLQNLACFLNQQSSHRAICILGINKYLSKNVKTEKILRKPLFQIFNSIFSKFSTPYVFFQKIGEHLSLLLKLSPFSHFMKKKKEQTLCHLQFYYGVMPPKVNTSGTKLRDFPRMHSSLENKAKRYLGKKRLPLFYSGDPIMTGLQILSA